MKALELVKALYKGTGITASATIGIISNQNLDCNCIDCDEDADCSTPW